MNEEEYGYEYDDEIEYYAIRPNKTQIKKDIAALFKLAEEMSHLSAAHLASLELPEKIHKAVAEVSGMPLNGARKRLLKFVAGQLHKMDVTPFVEKLACIKNISVHAVRQHHITERWRDRLLADADALTDLLDEWPQADRQQLRQLIRNAHKEAAMGSPPKSARLLYQYLKTLFNTVEDSGLDAESYSEFDEALDDSFEEDLMDEQYDDRL